MSLESAYLPIRDLRQSQKILFLLEFCIIFMLVMPTYTSLAQAQMGQLAMANFTWPTHHGIIHHWITQESDK